MDDLAHVADSSANDQMNGDGAAEEVDDYHASSHQHVLSDCDLCVLADHRIFYLHHPTKRSFWEPPRVSWNCQIGLPYGWEEAVDACGSQYYINHLTRTTTYDDPRQGSSDQTTEMSGSVDDGTMSEGPESQPLRTVKIQRDSDIGFGFVAASQHPVIIQFVTLGGPSDGKLMANDQIIEVNGMDMSGKGKDEVVSMIRSSASLLTLTVSQLPPRKPSSKRRHCRVRFQDTITVSSVDNYDGLPIIPNVIRVFLENGQTKSFKYDQTTTVQNVLDSLVEKLQLRSANRFALTSEPISSRVPRYTLIANSQLLCDLAARPSARAYRCRFRLTFVPTNMREFAEQDPHAFNYLYEQCVNDIAAGRYSFEMRYEVCVRLAALHLRQVAIDTNSLKSDGRASISRMEKEYGLATFLPTVLLENVKRREIRKHLRFYLKKDDDERPQAKCKQGINPKRCALMKKNSLSEEMPSFSMGSVIADSVDVSLALRLKYVQIVSHLPSFGGRCFSVTFKQTHVDMVMQIDPVQGLLVRHPGKFSQPTISIDYGIIESLLVSHETDVLRRITVKLRNTAQQGLEFIVDKQDVLDLVMYICGYCNSVCDKELQVDYVPPPCGIDDPNRTLPPPYRSSHYVYPAGWNYSDEVSCELVLANFCSEPPQYSQAIGATVLPDDVRDTNTLPSNGTRKSSLARPSHECAPFIDDASAGSVDTLSPKPFESPSSRRSIFLQVTESFSKARSPSPRFRDSIRIYRQRHSVPNGTPLLSTSSLRRSRRLSSSSETDCSQSPLLPRAEGPSKALTALLSPVSPHARPTSFFKRHSLTNCFGDHKSTSFGLNSPDQLPQLPSARVNYLLSQECFNKSQLEHLLALFPDKVCTDSEITDLTTALARLHESSLPACGTNNSAPPKPPRRSYSPLARNPEEAAHASSTECKPGQVGVNGVGHAQSLNNNSNSEKQANGYNHQTVFPTSKTFPMNDTDFGDDFVPKTYAVARKEWEGQEAASAPQVRRMSLKDFTGLEPKAPVSPLISRLHRTSIATSTLPHNSNLLSSCSNRRRSLSHFSRGPLANVSETAETAHGGSANSVSSPRLVHEPIDFDLINKRLTQLRNRLATAMESVPNESPKKRFPVDADKSKMMEELSQLAAGCKHMVRATTLPGSTEEQWRGIVLDTVDSAEKVAQMTEALLRKSSSLYHAQILTSKTDQMLRALQDTMQEMKVAYGAPQYGEEAKQLIRKSTTLAATLSQLIQAVQSL